MAFTLEEYNELKAAVASGVLEVEYYNERRVKYQSLQAMRELLASMEAELFPNAPGRSGGRYVATCKGV